MSRPPKLSVDRRPRPPKPKPEQRRRERKLTIATGFRCSDGVLLCADTEHTLGDQLKFSSSKISVIDAKGLMVAIAGAGDAAFIRMAFEKAVDRVLACDEIESIKGAIEETILDIHDKHIRLYPGEQKPYFDLLVAAWTEKERRATLLRTSSTAIVDGGLYECIGMETGLAHYLIDKLYRAGISTKYAAFLAVNVLQQTKKYTPYCGGASHIMILDNDGHLAMETTGDVVDREQYFHDYDSVTRDILFECADLDLADDEFKKRLSLHIDGLIALRKQQKANQETHNFWEKMRRDKLARIRRPKKQE